MNSLKNQEKEEAKHLEPEEPIPVMGLYVAENPKWYGRPRPADKDEEVCIDKEKGWAVPINKQISCDVKTQIIEVIREFQDVFAYTVNEMLGIDPQLMVHRLNITNGHRLVKQILRHQGV